MNQRTVSHYRIASYHDLHPDHQAQLESMMSHDYVPMPESERFQWMAGPKTHTVALLRRVGRSERVIAALQTDGRQKVLNWAGRFDRIAIKQLGHTPAHELMLHHVARLGERNLTYEYGMQDTAANFFDRRALGEGAELPITRGIRRTITLSRELRETPPSLPLNPKAWQPVYWAHHKAAEALRDEIIALAGRLAPSSIPRPPEVEGSSVKLNQSHAVLFHQNAKLTSAARKARVNEGIKLIADKVARRYGGRVAYAIDSHGVTFRQNR